MAGRRAMSHEDLLHRNHNPKFRGGVTAAEDLRVSKKDGSGVRPAVLQMLSGGGMALRGQSAGKDLRFNKQGGGAQERMLWKGGSARDKPLAGEDLRGTDPGLEPQDDEMLADGGEVSHGLNIAAEDVMAAFKSGKPSELASALKSFYMICGSEEEPHDEEAPPEGPPGMEEAPE